MEKRDNIGGLGPLQPYFAEFCRELNIISLDDMTHAGITSQFISWIGRKWIDWREETNNHRELSNEDHAAFAAWLPGKVDSEIKRIEETPELNCHGDGDEEGRGGVLRGSQMPDDWDGETERTEPEIEASEDHDRRALDP